MRVPTPGGPIKHSLWQVPQPAMQQPRRRTWECVVADRAGAAREPLQYLCNLAHWRDITLAVGPGVLIPRPETELLVDFAEAVRT